MWGYLWGSPFHQSLFRQDTQMATRMKSAAWIFNRRHLIRSMSILKSSFLTSFLIENKLLTYISKIFLHVFFLTSFLIDYKILNIIYQAFSFLHSFLQDKFPFLHSSRPLSVRCHDEALLTPLLTISFNRYAIFNDNKFPTLRLF